LCLGVLVAKMKGKKMSEKIARFGVAAEETWRVFRIMAEFVEGFEELATIGPAG